MQVTFLELIPCVLDTFSNLQLTSAAAELVQDYAIGLLSTADSGLLPVVVKYLLKLAGLYYNFNILCVYSCIESHTSPSSINEVLALWRAIKAQLNDFINANKIHSTRGKCECIG